MEFNGKVSDRLNNGLLAHSSYWSDTKYDVETKRDASGRFVNLANDYRTHYMSAQEIVKIKQSETNFGLVVLESNLLIGSFAGTSIKNNY